MDKHWSTVHFDKCRLRMINLRLTCIKPWCWQWLWDKGQFQRNWWSTCDRYTCRLQDCNWMLPSRCHQKSLNIWLLVKGNYFQVLLFTKLFQEVPVWFPGHPKINSLRSVSPVTQKQVSWSLSSSYQKKVWWVTTLPSFIWDCHWLSAMLALTSTLSHKGCSHTARRFGKWA